MLTCADCDGVQTIIRLASGKKFKIEMTYWGIIVIHKSRRRW
ncbi:copper resistance protein NlpE N-terminal domain-containing protein [Flavobacterium chuncheonense]|uniref:Copper resistance protein NlpE N-terminal domain-containing protein n=1 Tax=Flavobacterium chuncheonense TaxID=2026653 RepID=A0ABW5YPB7_9FLAO